jgi:hypothetical protein
MKGLINKLVQGYAVERLGTDAWDKIKESAGCTEPFFALAEDYPDEMTAALIRGTSDLARLPEDVVLEECAKLGVPNTLAAAYPIHYRLGGENARIFLLKMQRVVEEAARGVRGATLPEFECEELPGERLLITALSHPELCPLMRGLILGVGRHFGQKLGLREILCVRHGADRCKFVVDFP